MQDHTGRLVIRLLELSTVRDDGGWHQCCGRRGIEKWSNSGYIWKTWPAGADERVDIKCERKKAISDELGVWLSARGKEASVSRNREDFSGKEVMARSNIDLGHAEISIRHPVKRLSWKLYIKFWNSREKSGMKI